MDVAAWKAAAERVYDLDDGRTIKYRVLSKADLPQAAWPIFNAALAAYLSWKSGTDGGLNAEETKVLEKAQGDLERMAERDDANEIQVRIIEAACIDPKVVDHRKDNVPDDAVPLYAIEQLHQERLCVAIINASTGLDKMLEAASEAETAASMAGFRDGNGDLPDGDGAVAADGPTSVGVA